ncbi:MAG: hypothetical protein JXA33_08785 [Anaerolineae bacterium]|nr:hypothetical protein [Anaerolineae bacterium]
MLETDFLADHDAHKQPLTQRVPAVYARDNADLVQTPPPHDNRGVPAFRLDLAGPGQECS